MSLVHRELITVAQHVEQRATIRCKVAEECLAHVGLSVVSGKLVVVVLTSNFILLTHSSKSSIWCVRRQMIAFSNFSTHAEISPRTEVRNLWAVRRKWSPRLCSPQIGIPRLNVSDIEDCCSRSYSPRTSSRAL